MKIVGDVVECGVWGGGLTMTQLFAAIKTSDVTRRFILFDTFNGLPHPSHANDDLAARHRWDMLQDLNSSVKRDARDGGAHGKWNYAPLQLVMNNVLSTGYPCDRIDFVKGKVEDTLLSTSLPERIALLRLDTDWYDSTAAELNILWDRVIPGCHIIIDDYCAWKGARRAVDNFLAQRNITLQALMTSATVECPLILRKPA